MLLIKIRIKMIWKFRHFLIYKRILIKIKKLIKYFKTKLKKKLKMIKENIILKESNR
jgi:hypothetical protein